MVAESRDIVKHAGRDHTADPGRSHRRRAGSTLPADPWYLRWLFADRLPRMRGGSVEEKVPAGHDPGGDSRPGTVARRWIVLFCDAHAKRCPVSDFVEDCRVAQQIKLFRILDLLEQMGPGLPRPYADTLRDGVHELRVTLSGEQVRMLYFFCYEYFIVFYAVLRKHTDRVPDRDIEATRQYRDDFLRRIDRGQLESMAYGHA